MGGRAVSPVVEAACVVSEVPDPYRGHANESFLRRLRQLHQIGKAEGQSQNESLCTQNETLHAGRADRLQSLTRTSACVLECVT